MSTNFEESIRRLDRMIESIGQTLARGEMPTEVANTQLNAYQALRTELIDVMGHDTSNAERALLDEEFVLEGDAKARDIPLALTAIPYERFPLRDGGN